MRDARPAARLERDLCNGPAKLCQALGITGSDNGVDLLAPDGSAGRVRRGARVGARERSAWWTTGHRRRGVPAAGRGSASRRRRRSVGASGCPAAPPCPGPDPGVRPRGEACNRANGRGRGCHRAVTTVQQRQSIMLASDFVVRGRSRRSAGGARLPAAGWRPGGGGKPVELRAPGGMRRAGWLTACHRTVRRGGHCRANRAVRAGHPRRLADVPLRSAASGSPGSCPETIWSRQRVDAPTGAC